MPLFRDPEAPLLLDGAMGTELIARGLRVRQECPEAWNLDRPEEVRAVHAAYHAAGAEVVQTNTFGATRPRLARFGREIDLRALCVAGARLAREAAPGRAIWGSLGPTGETMPLAGSDLGWVEALYAEAAAALVEGGVDALHLETQFHPGELAAAVRGARQGAGDRPVYASITLMAGATGLETPHGVPLARMIRSIEETEPDAVGVNCSIEAERMVTVVRALREALDLPILCKPQAKMSAKCATGKSSETAEAFARHALDVVAEGVAAIGGCCGVSPSWIAELGRQLRERKTRVAS